MTEEKQAVKTLAEELVRAMKSVSRKSNGGSTSTQIYGSGSAETIYASQIIGLPDALYLALSDIEDSAAAGDAMAAALLDMFHRISAIEVESIAADTAQIENLYATFGDFISLVAQDAQIGSLDVEQIRADMAEIGLADIDKAKITSAQIVKLSTDTAFIREGVQGEIYIDDLAVSEANIVNLAVGTLLLNDGNGNLVRLYVDSSGHPTTEPVTYSGNSIIDSNSLSGNRIVQSSITADRLNVSEIFAKNALVMDLIADNINATRLFANEGVIPQLETTIIASPRIGEDLDLTNNSSIVMLNDRISLTAASTGKTFIQNAQPLPNVAGDVWLDPETEEHYVSTGVVLPDNPEFAYDDNGYLKYNYKIKPELGIRINSGNDLQLENDTDGVNFFFDSGYIAATGQWKKVENIAFSNLTIKVDGIEAEVYNSEGHSRITQNADEITSLVTKTGVNSLGSSETLFSKISQNATNITSLVTKTGVNGLGANETLFSKISQTADGVESLVLKTGVNSLGQSETLYSKISQTDSSINLIVNGTTAVGKVSTSGIDIQNNSLTVKSTGSINLNAGGTLNATAGTVNLTTNDINIGFNTSGSSDTKSKVKINKTDGIKVYDSYGNYFQASGSKIGLYNSNGTAKLSMDGNGNAIFTGSLSANCINGGTLNGSYITAGTLTADKISADGITADKIKGGTLTLGGSNNTNGSAVIKNASGTDVVKINNNGITISSGKITVDGGGTFNNITATGGTFKNITVTGSSTFAGTLDATCITSGYISAARLQAGSIVIGKLSTDVQNEIGKAGTALDKANSAYDIAGTANTNALNAAEKTQQIYISRAADATQTAPTKWVTNSTGDNDVWTTVRPEYSRSHPYLYTATQALTTGNRAKIIVEPHLDYTTTIIDGAHILTGTVTANQIAANAITADKINTNAITADKIKTKAITTDKIDTNAITADKIKAGEITVSKLTGSIANGNWKLDFDANDGAGSFSIGNISANNITSGYISADRIGTHSINVEKLSGLVSNGDWSLNFNDGTFSIGSISANNINAGKLAAKYIDADNLTVAAAATISGTLSANKIQGGTLTLGGSNNINGSAVINNDSGSSIVTLDVDGITVNSGKIVVNGGGTFNNITTVGGTFNNITAVGGTFSGNLTATTTTFNKIQCKNYTSSSAGIINPNAYGSLNIDPEGISTTPPSTYFDNEYSAVYSFKNGKFYYGAKNGLGTRYGITITNSVGDSGNVVSEVTAFNMGDTCKSSVATQLTPYIVKTKRVAGATTNENGNVDLGIGAVTRYAVINVRCLYVTYARIVTPFQSSNGTWYAHVVSAVTGNAVVNETNMYYVAYIDLGANGYS